MDYGGLIGILLLLIGIFLLVIEAIIPGFSLPGIGGIVLTIMGLVQVGNYLNLSGFGIILLVVFAIGLLGLIFYKIVNSKRFKKVILSSSLKSERGYSSSKSMEEYLGLEGVAQTDLRPSGYGVFEDVRLDVLSEGDYIRAGSQIKIVGVEGSKIIVRRTSI